MLLPVSRMKHTPARVFCRHCQRWLEHYQAYCPLFPKVRPQRVWDMGEPSEKWEYCCCLIHTCYKAKKVKDRRKAATYRD